ncbi:MAG: hypothetical protein LBC39_01215 [Methanobrevibacter sp.]|nr:hypothetical protein [Candidatus Methanovirga aequatorialis]
MINSIIIQTAKSTIFLLIINTDKKILVNFKVVEYTPEKGHRRVYKRSNR